MVLLLVLQIRSMEQLGWLYVISMVKRLKILSIKAGLLHWQLGVDLCVNDERFVMKYGESLMEKHIVSRSEISVERHFDHSCSLSLNAVMKLLQMLDRDMEKGDEEKCPALSVAKNSAAKNTSLYGMILKNRASGSVEVQNAFKLLNAN